MNGIRSGRVWKLALAFAPALVLLLGTLGARVIQPNRFIPAATPLAQFPDRVAAFRMTGERTPGEAELRLLGADDYVSRVYRDDVGTRLTLSIAYFGRQLSGTSIHSPRNCLPGSGWQPVEHERVGVETPYGPGSVNRYVVEHESGARAVVFYWYQGRGRVAASEYAVKWELLRDAVLKRRTDEALVRLVFPVRRGEKPSAPLLDQVVSEVARTLVAYLPA